MSTESDLRGIYTVATQSQEDGLRWFQLYLPHDDKLALSILQRAHDNGFEACMMTLDTWQLAWRHQDIALANYAFYDGRGNELGWTDPRFKEMLKERGIDVEKDPKAAGRTWIDQVWHGKAHSWEKMYVLSLRSMSPRASLTLLVQLLRFISPQSMGSRAVASNQWRQAVPSERYPNRRRCPKSARVRLRRYRRLQPRRPTSRWRYRLARRTPRYRRRGRIKDGSPL